MFKIKQLLGDFYVKEIMKLNFNNGNYGYFLLKKKNLTTLDSLNIITNKLKIDLRFIRYAGNKDKKAITEQYVSVYKRNKNLKLRNLELEFLGCGKERIKLGENTGNYFKIVVRNLNKK